MITLEPVEKNISEMFALHISNIKLMIHSIYGRRKKKTYVGGVSVTVHSLMLVSR